MPQERKGYVHAKSRLTSSQPPACVYATVGGRQDMAVFDQAYVRIHCWTWKGWYVRYPWLPRVSVPYLVASALRERTTATECSKCSGCGVAQVLSQDSQRNKSFQAFKEVCIGRSADLRVSLGIKSISRLCIASLRNTLKGSWEKTVFTKLRLNCACYQHIDPAAKIPRIHGWNPDKMISSW